jgi:fatty acid desaturase
MKSTRRLTNAEARAFVSLQNAEEREEQSRREMLAIALVLVGLCLGGLLALALFGGGGGCQ